MKRFLILTVLLGGSLVPLCMRAAAVPSGAISATPNPCVIMRQSTSAERAKQLGQATNDIPSERFSPSLSGESRRARD
jgi:hypothetical protein